MIVFSQEEKNSRFDENLNILLLTSKVKTTVGISRISSKIFAATHHLGATFISIRRQSRRLVKWSFYVREMMI